MSDNIIQFPTMITSQTPNDALEAAKLWDFEQVIIIGISKEPSETILVTAEHQDKRLYLEMAELLRVMYLNIKGWMK